MSTGLILSKPAHTYLLTVIFFLHFFFLQAVPPLEVTNLLEELRDGHVLLSLLEVLLGTTLVNLFIDSACLSISFVFQEKQTNRNLGDH